MLFGLTFLFRLFKLYIIYLFIFIETNKHKGEEKSQFNSQWKKPKMKITKMSKLQDRKYLELRVVTCDA